MAPNHKKEAQSDSQSNAGMLLFCASGIYVFYITLGYIQERMTKAGYGEDKEIFPSKMISLLVMCIVNAIVAFLLMKLWGDKSDGTPIWRHLCCSASYLCAMTTSNLALNYVSYPTQVLAKSCKPIPVMLFGVLVTGTRHPLTRYVCVLFMCLGIALFSYKEALDMEHVNNFFSAMGTLDSSSVASMLQSAVGPGAMWLTLSLVCDGITGPQQTAMKRLYHATSRQLMFYTNFYAMFYLAIFVVYHDELPVTIAFVQRHPSALTDVLLYGLTSACGQVFVFLTVVRFSPLRLSIVTTTRKFFTVLFSVLLYAHVVLPHQWLGIFLVIGALLVDSLISISQQNTKKKSD